MKFILCLVILAFVARLALAPLYISLPGEAYSIIPHDFPKYMATAQSVLNGTLYITDTHIGHNSASPYGPLLALSWAGWLKTFGQDYTLFKIPSIIYDTLSVVVVFYLAKSLSNIQTAKYASILYAFSFMPLIISGAEGAGDSVLIFFLLLATYFLLKTNPNIKLSSLFLGIALLVKFVVGVVFIPLILYYFWRQKNIRQGFVYLAIILLTVSLVTFPFFLSAGTNVFSQVIFPASVGISGTTLLSAIKMVVNYFTFGMSNTYNDNQVIQQFASPLIALSLIGSIIYIVRFGLEEKKIEFIRNVFVMILMVNIFGNVGYHHIFVWLIPYIIILLVYKRKFKFSPLVALGLVFVVSSTMIYSAFYRETKIPEYTILEQSFLLSSVLLSIIGTYLSLRDIPWTLSTFAWALWLTNHAKLLMVLSPVLHIFSSPLWAYGIQDFSSVVFVVLTNFLLFFSIHRRMK